MTWTQHKYVKGIELGMNLTEYENGRKGGKIKRNMTIIGQELMILHYQKIQ